MKKVIICNITMKEKTDKCVYTSDDKSVVVSNEAVVYPISAFFSKNVDKDDEVRLILLVKKDPNGNYKKNAIELEDEINAANKEIGAKIEYRYVETDFSEDKRIHEQLMGKIVEEIEDDSHIIADITYGPKDLPIVLFTALNFAEKFLGCVIDNIIYGQANFVDGKPVNTKICDMVPLYYLNAITNTIVCEESDKARTMLKTLLSF